MKKILLIESNKNLKKLLISILEDIEEEEINIIEEEDVEKSIQIINTEVPDIVFIHGGDRRVEYTRIHEVLKTHIKLKRIKVVLLTTREEICGDNHKKNTGVDLYLYKPFDPEFLLEKLCDMLNINYV
ncbi:response regulator [Clostridium hydrogeniformans]|uniref:response regulator n=1 Tax=Clostridium hydrogeniformans TaxID=349933 RepID=UPI0004840057|nr:response regulator [Clostridium hydrogeniformans]